MCGRVFLRPDLPGRDTPGLACEPLGLAGGRCTPVTAGRAIRIDDRTRCRDECASRILRECGGELGRAPALRADPRQEERRLRQERARACDVLREGRADDGADRGEAPLADELLAELADELRDVLPELATVGEHDVLDVG